MKQSACTCAWLVKLLIGGTMIYGYSWHDLHRAKGNFPKPEKFSEEAEALLQQLQGDYFEGN